MADSALKGAMFSVEKGFTGVGSKRTTLDAITKGVKDVNAWKTDIDAKRLKLKTDISTALSAKEKSVYETDYGDVTQQQKAIELYDVYRDNLKNIYDGVRNGSIPQSEMPIYMTNASQGFDIISKQAEDYGATLEKINENLASGVSGSVENVIATYYTGAANLKNNEYTFTKNGTINVTNFKTKRTDGGFGTELKLDENGLPIPIDTRTKLTVKQFNKFPETKRFNANETIALFTGKDTAIGEAWSLLKEDKNFVGNVHTTFKNNPNFAKTIMYGINGATSTWQNIASITSDDNNMLFNKEGNNVNVSYLTNYNYEQLEPEEKAEKIEYYYRDLNTGELVSAEIPKYAQIIPENGSFVLQDTEGLIKNAARNATGEAVYNALSEKTTRGITPPQEKTPTDTPLNKIQDKRKRRAGVDLLKKINQYTSGSQEEVTGAGEGLNISSELKYRSVKDTVEKIEGEDVVVGLDLMLVNKNGSTTPVKIPYYTQNSEGEYVQRPYIDILEDKYNAFKGVGAPDFGTVIKEAKSQGINLNNTLSAANRDREREVVKIVEVTEIQAVTPSTALDTKGNTAISATLKSAAFRDIEKNMFKNEVDGSQGPDLALQLQSSFGQMAEKQGSNQGSDVKFEFDQAKGTIKVIVKGKVVSEEKITGNDESLKTAVSTMLAVAAEKGLPSRKKSKKKVSSIGNKITFQDWLNIPGNKGKSLDEWKNSK